MDKKRSKGIKEINIGEYSGNEKLHDLVLRLSLKGKLRVDIHRKLMEIIERDIRKINELGEEVNECHDGILRELKARELLPLEKNLLVLKVSKKSNPLNLVFEYEQVDEDKEACQEMKEDLVGDNGDINLKSLLNFDLSDKFFKRIVNDLKFKGLFKKRNKGERE